MQQSTSALQLLKKNPCDHLCLRALLKARQTTAKLLSLSSEQTCRMTVKHLRIDVEAYKPAPSAEIMAEALKSRIKSVVEQEANLEIDPAVIEDERTLVVSLRLRRDRPLKQAEVRQCEDLLPFVLRIISALSLPWQAIRILSLIHI